MDNINAKKEYARKYRVKKKEKISLQKKTYYEKNKEKILEKQKIKRRSNGIKPKHVALQKIQQVKKDWYIKNKDSILSKSKLSRQSPQSKIYQRTYQKEYRRKKKFIKNLEIILKNKLKEIQKNKKLEMVKLEDIQIFITSNALNIIADELGLFIV